MTYPDEPAPASAADVHAREIRTRRHYLGKVHFIRADLYAGQPCAPSGDPYVFSPRIGYYECVR